MPGSLPDFPFRRTAHDRLSERREDEEFLRRAWDDPTTRVVVVADGELATTDAADELRLVSPAGSPVGERFLLGTASGVVHFAVVARPPQAVGTRSASAKARDAQGARDDAEVGSGPFAGLRQLVTRLDDVSASLAVHAVALAGWHQRHPRCARCGSGTEPAAAGAFRRCPSCGAAHFPRTDPAVIMLVTDADDRCLLGHNRGRPAGWFSTLAGFVEPGETPEQAVVREVREEVGVEVGSTSYAGSQPWPFPSSLMLGYFADATTTSVTVDGDEISAARWFTRDELTKAVQTGDIAIPTTVSIAGALLTAWYGAPLPENVLTA